MHIDCYVIDQPTPIFWPLFELGNSLTFTTIHLVREGNGGVFGEGYGSHT